MTDVADHTVPPADHEPTSGSVAGCSAGPIGPGPAPTDDEAPVAEIRPATADNAAPTANPLLEGPALNPAQQQVRDTLGARKQDRPTFRPDLRDDLRTELEEALQPLLADASPLPLSLSKHDLALLHGCEARYVADKQIEFAWSVPTARGSVVHKAIELLITWRRPLIPLDLVDEALARLEQDERGIGLFIQGLSEAERAELAGAANDFVATFLETFPPLDRRWRPVAESRVRAELCADNLALQGRVDLSLGRADGMIAGKVLIDLKTGRPYPGHVEDLRFYALLETLKLGVPPRLLVNYYLESGQPRPEAVTEDLLWSTARRLVDAVAKLVTLVGPEAREPATTPGPGCRWCSALPTCTTGQRFLKRLDDEDDRADLDELDV